MAALVATVSFKASGSEAAFAGDDAVEFDGKGKDDGRVISTFVALLPGWSLWCASPATTSTSSGGSAVRLTATAGGALDSVAALARVTSCFLATEAGAETACLATLVLAKL